MTNYISAKQNAFARSLAEGATQAESYRTAYRPSPTTTEKSIHERASRIAAMVKVRSRVAEFHAHVQAHVFEHHRVTTETLMAEAHEAYCVAMQKADPSGMVGATRLKAMLAGLLVRARDSAFAALAELPEAAIHRELARVRGERLRQVPPGPAAITFARAPPIA